MNKSFDPQHDFEHIERVRKNALKITKILRLENKVDKNLLQAACLLHDLIYSVYPPSFKIYLLEGYLTKKIVPSILDKIGVKEKDKTTIINSIGRHPHSFPLKMLNKNSDFYTKILQDADTLDLFNEERLKSFRRSSQKSIFHKILSILAVPVFKYGRINIKKFLNLPEIARNFYV